MKLEKEFIFFALPIWLFGVWVALYQPIPLVSSWGSDYWEHAAVLNSWMKDIVNPMSPHVVSDVGSPRYMPFYFIITLIAKLLGLNAIEAMGLAGVVNISLLVFSIRYYTHTLYSARIASIVAFLVLFFFWGSGWRWSNVYQLSDLYYVISYPSFFVFSISFFAFGIVLNFLKYQRINFYTLILIIFLSFIMLSSHPLTGAVSLMAMGLISIFETNADNNRRILSLLTIFLGAILVELWPYYSTWNVILGTSSGSSNWVSATIASSASTTAIPRIEKLSAHPFYSPLQVLVTFGPTIIGFPILLYYLKHRRYLFMVSGASITFIIYIMNLFFAIPLGHRFLLFSIFFFHLLIISYIVENIERFWKASHYLKKSFMVGFIVIVMSGNIILAIGEPLGYTLKPNLKIGYRDLEKPKITDYMYKLNQYTKDKSIILASGSLAWPIPAFQGKVISNFHMNPMIPDREVRRRDVKLFFMSDTSFEKRLAIIQKYKVSHILYNSSENLNLDVSEVNKFQGDRYDVYDLKLISLRD